LSLPLLPPGTVPFTYWVLAPVLDSGFSILGELAKVVPFSKRRISSIATSGAETETVVGITGEPGEVVDLSYVYVGTAVPVSSAAAAAVSSVACTIGSGGTSRVTCKAATGMPAGCVCV
jgi:hypothetical protein